MGRTAADHRRRGFKRRVAYRGAEIPRQLLERRSYRTAALEISTVDGFQGREKEIIIISCVRSNAKRSVGFVSDYRRMNVAVTRARALCIVVGDSETLEADTMLKSLVEHIEDRGEYASAQQLVDDLNVVL